MALMGTADIRRDLETKRAYLYSALFISILKRDMLRLVLLNVAVCEGHDLSQNGITAMACIG